MTAATRYYDKTGRTIKRTNRKAMYSVAYKMAYKNLDQNETPAVQHFCLILNGYLLKYHREHPVVALGKARRSLKRLGGQRIFLVDFWLPEIKTLIEIDGGYHTTPEQIKKDTDRDNYIKSVGYHPVLRLTNEEVLHPDFDLFTTLIRRTKKNQKKRIINYLVNNGWEVVILPGGSPQLSPPA